MKVPFVDLRGQYLTIRSEIDSAIAQVLEQSAFIRGPFVEEFEKQYGSAMGMPHCLSCGNGTDSLYIALKALGVGPGQEVITTAHSWIATSETITQAGGRVVFVDTDYDTFTIDPERIEGRITRRTTGLVVVHLYGQPAEMNPVLALAKQRGLWVIEDCAQAHLARYQGTLVGTMGNAGAYSFYPGKNLGAYGDAGCLVTSAEALARQMTMFARHGGMQKGQHEIEGMNSRMDGLQAAILAVKLKYLPRWTEARQRIAATYDRLLQAVGDVVIPIVAPGREHVYHQYVIRTEKRDELRNWLEQRGITTAVSYPIALPFLKAYAYLGHQPSDFPIAHANQSRILSLPIFPEMTEEMINYVVEQIRAFYRA